METETPNPKILLVFVGRANGAKPKDRYARYLRVTREEYERGEIPTQSGSDVERLYAANKNQKKYMMGSVGAVYEVETPTDNPTSILSGTARQIGRWPDRAMVTLWAAKDAAAMAQLDAIEARGEESRYNEIKSQLEPIRKAYQSLPYPHRPFFLAQMVDFLNRTSERS